MMNIKKQKNRIIFDYSLDTCNYSIYADKSVNDGCYMSSDSIRLLCSAIMHAADGDEGIRPYTFSRDELSEIFDVNVGNTCKYVDTITDEIFKSPVSIRTVRDGEEIGFVTMPWIAVCGYEEDGGLYLKLNGELKPLITTIKEYFTEYIEC